MRRLMTPYTQYFHIIISLQPFLRFSNRIRTHSTFPSWARQMIVFGCNVKKHNILLVFLLE